jgi:hypothetical protein
VPKGLSSVVRDNLEKCRSAAIAAVDVYNRPGPGFRTAHYIVLLLELVLRQRLGLGGPDHRGVHRPQILRDRADREPERPGHRPHAQVARLQGDHCFNFDMETLSFGIDLAPPGQNPEGYAVDPPINLQPPAPSATMVNRNPPS